VILTYKYRIKDRTAKKQLKQHAWAVNQVWNWCNSYQKNIEDKYFAGAAKRKWPTAFDLEKLCAGVGTQLGIYAQTVGAVCQQFVSNRNAKRGSLRFRSSFGSGRSLGWIPLSGQGIRVSGNSVFILKRVINFLASRAGLYLRILNVLILPKIT
jgi:putative transposase